jgi:hypothetical protein
VLEGNLQPYVPVPKTGAPPVKGLKQPHLDISVKWMDANGNPIEDPIGEEEDDGDDGGEAKSAWSYENWKFEERTQYRAEIKVTVGENYIFDPSLPFKYPEGTVEEQPGDEGAPAPDTNRYERTIVVTYKHTEELKVIEMQDLRPYIPIPEPSSSDVDILPVTSFYAPGYTGAVVWTETAEAEAEEKETVTIFKPDIAYTATVKLTPMAGYVFPDGPVTVVHSEAIAPAEFEDTDNGTRTGNINFSEAGLVNRLNLTSYIPKPVSGQYPETTIEVQPQYVGTIRWNPPVPEGDKFASNKDYIAEVTLDALREWSFPEGGEEGKRFFHEDAAEDFVADVFEGRKIATLRIKFPRTQEEGEED